MPKMIKMIKKAHSTRRPSKLETQLRMSIKLAKLEKRINLLEAEVLKLTRRDLFIGKANLPPDGTTYYFGQ
jgi:hypothetical protein